MEYLPDWSEFYQIEKIVFIIFGIVCISIIGIAIYDRHQYKKDRKYDDELTKEYKEFMAKEARKQHKKAGKDVS